MLYNICGLNVFYEPKYDITSCRSEKYIADDQSLAPDITLDVTEERIDRYIKVYPGVPRPLAEYGIYGAEFHDAVLDYGGFLLHSSAVAVDNRAYLFTADSGTGKSTHSELWMKYFGSRAVMINDDKPVVRLIGGEIYACGTPFSGKNDINSNIIIPLQAICFLSRGESNIIEQITSGEALKRLMTQTIYPREKDKILKLFDILDRVLTRVKLYSLKCDISTQAVETSYNGMKPVSE